MNKKQALLTVRILRKTCNMMDSLLKALYVPSHRIYPSNRPLLTGFPLLHSSARHPRVCPSCPEKLTVQYGCPMSSTAVPLLRTQTLFTFYFTFKRNNWFHVYLCQHLVTPGRIASSIVFSVLISNIRYVWFPIPSIGDAWKLMMQFIICFLHCPSNWSSEHQTKCDDSGHKWCYVDSSTHLVPVASYSVKFVL